MLAWEPYQWQVIAVCGRNEKLRRRLARVRFATPTLILGFVDFMGGLESAHKLAAALAAGREVSSTRQSRLHARALQPDGELALLRTYGGQLARQAIRSSGGAVPSSTEQR